MVNEPKPFSLLDLPPKLVYGDLVGPISRASASIARLDGLLVHFKNPRLFSRSFITKEAVLSSQIEGTQATLNDVFEQEAKDGNAEESSKERDIVEIVNYRTALERGIELLRERPLTENVVKELHRLLLNSARGHGRAPGEFRKQQVFIGPPGAGIERATYVPPVASEIPRLFSNLERYMHGDGEQDTLVQIAVAHYQFEAIHPFYDGNGRIGRLLISLMLYEKKLLRYPYIYLSEFFEEHRRDYYDLLRGVSESGAWGDWISFFLRGLDVQAAKAQDTAQKIISLHDRLQDSVSTLGSKYAAGFLEAIFVRPVFTSRILRRHLKVRNSATLFSLIEKFKLAGIIEDATPRQRRNKVYRFRQLIAVLRKG